jgi:hypothetical protein
MKKSYLIGAGLFLAITALSCNTGQPCIITMTPSTVNVPFGSTGTTTLTLNRACGYTGVVTLSVDGENDLGVNLPSFTFSPKTTTGNTSSLTIGHGGAFSGGTDTRTVRATTSDNQSVTTNITLIRGAYQVP